MANHDLDKEKNRYFKIQPGSSSVATYSSHDIKKRKLRDEKQESAELDQKKQQGRIQRSRILNVPSVGGLLRRSSSAEIPNVSFDASPILARGLVEQGHIPSRAMFTTDSLFTVIPQPGRPGMQSEVWIGMFYSAVVN